MNGVYILRSPSGKEYIGSSNDISRRLKQHFDKLKEGNHKNRRLQFQYDTLGELHVETFEFEGLSRDDLFKEEQRFMSARQPSLNIMPYAKPKNWDNWKKKHEKKMRKKKKKKKGKAWKRWGKKVEK